MKRDKYSPMALPALFQNIHNFLNNFMINIWQPHAMKICLANYYGSASDCKESLEHYAYLPTKSPVIEINVRIFEMLG